MSATTIPRWGSRNDTLDGGEGNDQAFFAGGRDDYLISFDTATVTYTVTDLRAGSPEGTDLVRNALSASALKSNTSFPTRDP
jgi:serralysin